MKILNKRNIRIGERRQNISGLWMEIVEYRNQGDLDVRFDLGRSIVKHRKYDGFKNGSIKNPKYFLSRIGERYQNQNGYWFEIVGMISKTKAIIKFDDFDDLVIWDSYYNITHVKHPQEPKPLPVKRTNQLLKVFWKDILNSILKRQTELRWIGKTTINHQGLKMTIIKKTGKKIDVQFEDGTIVKDKWISTFKRACICNPNYSNSKTISRNEFCFYYYLKEYGFKHYEQGELKQYGLGQYTVDLFNPDLMVAIEYDGRFHRKEKDHRKNVAFSKRGIRILRVREPRADEFEDGRSINFYIENGNNFDPALTKVIKEVIDYLNTNYDIEINQDIDVIRDKDKILNQYLEETDYCLRNKRVGERFKNNQGLWAEIIEYRSSKDIDIKFDIDGSIQKHKRYRFVKEGNFPHSKYNQSYFDRQNRLGETNINISGYSMKIIEYRSSIDIDVEFEDGSIVEHTEYSYFKNGELKLPSFKKDRTGETVINRLGQSMKIIRWGGRKDIDVELDDGTIFEHKEYRMFKNGVIFHLPINNRIGQRFKTNKGLWIKIIEYRGSNDIDIKFEIDGTVLKHKTYSAIKSGSIRHPNRIDLIGQTKINRDGREMKLIKFRNCLDIDILFTDNKQIKKHERLYRFNNGSVGY